MFRYDRAQFDGLPRGKFLQALVAEGIPASGGYQPLDKEPFLKNTLMSRGFQAVYGSGRISEYLEKTRCPANDALCEVAVWLTQTMLLGPRSDMDEIAAAVRKVQKHGARLAGA
jgi:perosamine synthetase